MRIVSDRFGSFELDDADVIHFPNGLIGFPSERHFVLLRPKETSAIGWLHSTTTASLAFPVVSTEALAVDYPDVPLGDAAKAAGVGDTEEQCAILAVLSVSGAGLDATVNLLAPIMVNAETRVGAQVLLERSRFSTREPFLLKPKEKSEQGEAK